jgi:ABC-2 type transport system permease protein|tara:strand:- start:1111 stop:2427 length:1317 start_codon:yes stop_codon:yes gene_type:complete
MKKYIQIIRSEYIHLIRSPFKTLSLSLFVLAILYSCQNGYALFKKHNIEITNIVANNEDSIAKMLDQYEEIENGTQEKTRRDPTTPYWAIWNTPSYAFKYPSPMMVFSLGQAEQYGYYKKITNWSTTFDSDMAEEIANPERLAIGTLDFNFVFIYLFPILIIILLFNVGGLEKDLNFEKLILLNNITKRKWLFIRFLFYFILINILLLSLMLFYALIADVFQNETLNFIRLLFTSILYIILWFIIFYFINYYGKNSSDQALKMISIWLLLCIIIPGTIHQISSINYPVNYMTEYIDIDRDKSNDIFKLPTNTLRMQLFDKFPKLEKTFFANDLDIDKSIINRSLSGLINIENKNIALAIENSNEQKNKFIKSFYPINPVIAFQNQINSLTNTDYYSYLIYRREIQSMIDKKIDIILKDTWNNITVNKEIYTEYIRNFK